MSIIPIEDVEGRLSEFIAKLVPGEEVFLTRDDRPIAKLIALVPKGTGPRELGTLKGTVLYMAPNFDAPLEDFKEYME